MDEFGQSIFWALTAFAVTVLYLLPSILAFARNRGDRLKILVLNVAFGWTLVGWLAALIWCFSGEVETTLKEGA